MKGLSIEEKAKAYDEALERAKKYLGDCMLTRQEYAEKVFPELKESEEDMIRKLLIEAVIQVLQDQYCSNRGVSKEKVVAWLEKQGEQNRDKIEPKFEIRDWIVTDKNNVVQIKAIEDSKYVLENAMRFTIDYVDKCWRKWTILDAKDGDVLATKDSVFIFKHINKQGLSLCKSYCEIIGNSKLGFGFEFSINSVYPATKEQRDSLMKAMADAGCTFDFEKKELKKIEQKLAEWSEEDEEIYRRCICSMRASACGFPEEEKFVEKVDNWLKSLKERIQLQPKQEWKPSEAQLSELYYASNGVHYNRTTLLSLLEQLKKLKE